MGADRSDGAPGVDAAPGTAAPDGRVGAGPTGDWTATSPARDELAVGARAGTVLRAAAHTYRAQFGRIALTSLAVFVPIGVLTAVAADWASRLQGDVGGWRGLAVLAGLVGATSATTLALPFYAGVLDRIVGAHLHGHEQPRWGHVLRSIPYRRLLVADLLFWAVASATAALVLPALVIFTLFALVGPLIPMEDIGVLRAFRRSAHLVWHAFWLTLLLVTAPATVEIALMEVVEEAAWRGRLWQTVLVEVLVSLTLGATVAVIEIALAHALVARDRARQRPTG